MGVFFCLLKFQFLGCVLQIADIFFFFFWGGGGVGEW